MASLVVAGLESRAVLSGSEEILWFPQVSRGFPRGLTLLADRFASNIVYPCLSRGMAMTSQVNMITQHWQTLCHSLESVYLSLVFFLNGQCLFCKLLMQSNFLPIILTWTGIPTRKTKQLQVSTSVAGRTAKTQVMEYIESGELRKYDYYTNIYKCKLG